MATHYDGYRAGSGEPLVLLHPATGSWRTWQPVVNELTRRYDVFAPTMPGHRGGPPLAAPVTIDAIVDGVEETLDTAGVRTAHLVGNSLGGVVALELLRRGRARSVVNLNGPFAWRDNRDIVRLAMFFALNECLVRSGLPHVTATRSAWARRHMLRPLMKRGGRVSAEQVSSLLTDARHCSIVQPLLRSLLAEGPRPRLDVGIVPVQIVWSFTDHVAPYKRFGTPTAAHVPQAELIRLVDVGHVPMWDDPRMVVSIIDSVVMSSRLPPSDRSTHLGP